MPLRRAALLGLAAVAISKPKHHVHSNEWLRNRVIELRDEEEMMWEEIARFAGYSRKSCSTWYREAKETGFLQSQRWRRTHWHKLSLAAQHEMMAAIREQPDLYYDQLQHIVWQRTGEAVSVSTIGKMCRKAGLRHKRASAISLHRDKEAMRQHALLRQKIHYKQIISVDESHTAGRNLGRRYAKVRPGEGAYVPLSDHLGRAWTVLAAMNHTGLVDCHVQELAQKADDAHLPKAINRELWMHMFRTTILPYLQPCDERQLANSVVVIDNCSLHLGSTDEEDNADFVNELNDLVRSKGAILCYTPPYCPRSNPIEAMFHLMKRHIERHAHTTVQADPAAAIEAGLLSVSSEKADALVRRSEKDVRSWLRPGLLR
eukprot:COSAG01_NODE_6327_length_3734_cov_1.460523_1_plen_374_part_00